MAGIKTSRLFYLFFMVFCNAVYQVASTQNASIVDLNYDIHSLAEEEICHPLGNRVKTIVLSRAAIIRSNNVLTQWLHRTRDLVCKFRMIPRERVRLMAVIQSLSFRQVNGECLDYIKFKRKNQNETKKFCGQFDLKKTKLYQLISGSNYFNKTLHIYEMSDTGGEIETTIFVSKQPLGRNDPPLDIKIVYTPNEDCVPPYYLRVGDIHYPMDERENCIASEYMCDGYQNCVPKICGDEYHCPLKERDHTGDKIIVAAVTTIILCIVIFIMGLWMCRQNEKFCWGPDCAGPMSEDNRFSHSHGSGSISDQPVPTAPMLQVSAVRSALDKDLPPSYDSLFPNNANPSTA